MKYTGIGVHIKVRSFSKSLAFYEALGFTKVFSYGPDQEVKEDYHGAVFDTGAGKIEIADGHRAVKLSVFKEHIMSSKISLMVPVDDMEELMKRCKKAGIKLAVGPRHYYWGTIEVVVRDPDGVVLVFIAPYAKELATKLTVDERFGAK